MGTKDRVNQIKSTVVYADDVHIKFRFAAETFAVPSLSSESHDFHNVIGFWSLTLLYTKRNIV